MEFIRQVTSQWQNISELIVNFADVAGRCHVIFGENLDKTTTLAEWTAGGPFRFYFNQAYDSTNQSFIEPPPHATLIGSLGKVCVQLNQITALLQCTVYVNQVQRIL